jgi:hypothetical protein
MLILLTLNGVWQLLLQRFLQHFIPFNVSEWLTRQKKATLARLSFVCTMQHSCIHVFASSGASIVSRIKSSELRFHRKPSNLAPNRFWLEVFVFNSYALHTSFNNSLDFSIIVDYRLTAQYWCISQHSNQVFLIPVIKFLHASSFFGYSPWKHLGKITAIELNFNKVQNKDQDKTYQKNDHDCHVKRDLSSVIKKMK